MSSTPTPVRIFLQGFTKVLIMSQTVPSAVSHPVQHGYVSRTYGSHGSVAYWAHFIGHNGRKGIGLKAFPMLAMHAIECPEDKLLLDCLVDPRRGTVVPAERFSLPKCIIGPAGSWRCSSLKLMRPIFFCDYSNGRLGFSISQAVVRPGIGPQALQPLPIDARCELEYNVRGFLRPQSGE